MQCPSAQTANGSLEVPLTLPHIKFIFGTLQTTVSLPAPWTAAGNLLSTFMYVNLLMLKWTVKILLQWHPSKPSIVSTTNHGNILIWHCPSPERWGAFAGGFEEVDENVEYEEREDEFDIVRVFSFTPDLGDKSESSQPTRRTKVCWQSEK